MRYKSELRDFIILMILGIICWFCIIYKLSSLGLTTKEYILHFIFILSFVFIAENIGSSRQYLRINSWYKKHHDKEMGI